MKSALNLFGLKKTESGESGVTGLDQFLSALPEHLGYKIEFRKTDRSEGGLHFEVEGEEADSFIGNSSETLDALSHLAMRVQRKKEGLSNEPVTDDSKDTFRITFDAAGFRDRKAQELRDMAAQKRQKVLETGGKPAYIPALSPSDRKIIHTHLVELGDVVSESIGKGNFKRIRVRLKDESQRTPESREGGEERRPRQQHAQGPGGQGAGGNRGGRGGRGRGGRGRGGEGRGNGAGGPRDPNREVNGNRAIPEPAIEEIDDNVGNRLAPGEQPMFNYANPRGPQNND